MFDFHIHLRSADWLPEQLEHFKQETRKADVTAGAVFSAWPASFRQENEDQSWEHRLESVEQLAAQLPDFRKAFFLDPTEADAMKQIQTAREHGIDAFKIICTHFYPKEIIKQLQAIAETGRPVIFHSGILYSMHPTSDYNRPGAFECLLPIKGLRFSLAHISWPWTDELTALFGQFIWAAIVSPDKCSEMFVDVTPGTPPIFRRDALRKFYLTNYEGLTRHVVWGTDSCMDLYSANKTIEMRKIDQTIIDEIIRDSTQYGIKENDYADIWELLVRKNAETFFEHR